MGLDLKPVPGGRRHSFRVALRMARRDIRRHKGRSLLIVLLIMLPVAGMSGASALAQSTQQTATERVQFELGNTQARFRDLHAPNAESVQDPVRETGYTTSMQRRDPEFKPKDPKDAIPAGYSVLTESKPTLTAKVAAADVRLQATVVDALNPAFAGKYTLLEGRAPAADSEVLVSRGLLERFSITLGGQITTSAGTFTAVGKLRDATATDSNSILFLKPGQGKVPAQKGQLAETLYYLVGSEPVTWTQIRELNGVGVAALSRSVLLNPPPASELGSGAVQNYAAMQMWSVYLVGGLLGALALLEVGLLAGAAFAVGAKRQVRELALLAASGAEAPTVRGVVIAAGLWLGGVAVAAGAALGTGGAAAVVMVARLQGSVRFAGFHPDSFLIAVAMGLGLLACLLAAQAPARQVARQALLGALKSGRAPSVAGRWPSRIGWCMVVLAALALGAGAWLGMVGDDIDLQMSRVPFIALTIIGGAVLGVTGLVLLTGNFVAALTARTAWLPLSLRMAARDSARNRSRTVPAVAAILAAATLASSLAVLAASQFEDAKEKHNWVALKNQALLAVADGSAGDDGVSAAPGKSVDAGSVEAAVQGALGTVEWAHVLHAPITRNCKIAGTGGAGETAGGVETASGPDCFSYKVAVPTANVCPRTEKGVVKDTSDWRCQGSMYQNGIVGPIYIGGSDVLRAVLGREPEPAALKVLDSGGIVASNRTFVSDGKATLQATDISKPAGQGPQGTVFAIARESVVPAAVEAPDVPLPYFGVISPETAERLGMTTQAASLLIQLSETPDAGAKDKASAALAALYGVPGNGFYPEEGTDRDDSWLVWLIIGVSALITLSAAGITTGLALADARSDHMTLAGVGAPPRLRKSLAAGQSLMTAALGTLLGLFAGAIPTVVAVQSTRMFGVPTIPWLQLLALLVAVPLTGAALAWIFTRARLPMSRRSLGT